MICDCSTSEQERQLGIAACGADCLNRMLLIECGNRCPCGSYCTNRSFKTKNNANIAPFRTDMKGWGLKTFTDLKSETFLIEYVGEVIDLKEFKKRCEKYANQNNQHFYFMSLHNDLFIDATKKGNISRFFNHSCDPNCETQKWTVNGELRIGFFTRRPVQASEELTFDYQFQTVGKKQQKCFCGTEKCRGFLGASSTNNQSNQLDYIWEDESSESLTDDESSVNESELAEKEENGKSVKRKRVLSNKLEKVKKQKDGKDFDLSRQIYSIRSLSNKENVLKLCQLMFRTENLEMRLDLLDLLLNTNSDISLRLFMDYHGLKLLWGWMIDIDNLNETIPHLECKTKILQVLTMLSIKNRTILEECKLLTIVKKWSDLEIKANNSEQTDPLSSSVENEACVKSWIDEMVVKIMDKAVDESDKKNDSRNNEFDDLLRKLKVKAKDLHDEWSSLKQAFKIPKKQQIEERKEHERELNHFAQQSNDWSLSPPPQAQIANKMSFQFKNETNETSNFFRENRFKVRNRGFQYNDSKFRFNRTKYYNNYSDQNSQYKNHQTSTLTKEQRRQLFEQKVKEDEEKAAVEAAAQEAAAAEAELQSKQQAQQEMKWMFDSQTNQWIQCYVTVNPHMLVQPVSYASSMCVPPPPPPPNHHHSSEQSFQENLNKINLTDSNLKDLKQAIQFCQLPGLETQNGDEVTFKKTSSLLAGRLGSTQKSLSSISAKLPPNWKCKRNEKGFIYYYNLKTKKTQWHFPKIVKPINHKSLPVELGEAVEKSEKEVVKEDVPSQEASKISPAVTSTTTEAESVKTSATTEANSSGSVSNSSSSELFKVCKEKFREKLSCLVVKLLQPYLRKDCKYGRIEDTADFKHLARKFTHTIMEKEMSRATKLEELDLDKRIKVKTQDYVTRYMQKFHGIYSRNLDIN